MFTIQTEPIIRSSLTALHTGAIVTFEGIVRPDKNNSKNVSALFYHAETEACGIEGNKIIQESNALFPDTKTICVQRIGQVDVGEVAIWIATASSHRDRAYRANRYVIEEVKKRLRIWKKEIYKDGSSNWMHNKGELINL